jgi:hypothetical protein
MNLKKTALAQKWVWTLGATEKDFDEAVVEEDDVKEQAPVPPCQSVYEEGWPLGQSDRGAHDNNTNDSSYYELISVPLAPQRVSDGRQLMGWTNNSIYIPFTGDMTGKGQNVALLINRLNSMQWSCVLQLSSLRCWGTNWHYQQYLEYLLCVSFSVRDVTKSEMFFFLAIIIQITWYAWQPSSLLADNWTVVFIFLWQNYETWQISSHS